MTLGKLIELLNKAKEIHVELSSCEDQKPDYESCNKAWKKRRAAIIAKKKKLYAVNLSKTPKEGAR